MQSSHVARRILAVAAVSALPSVVLAAPQYTDPTGASREMTESEWSPNQRNNNAVGPFSGGGSFAGPASFGPEADVLWNVQSVRDRQFIAYGHPLLPAAPAATDPTNYPDWTDTAVWNPFPTGGNTAVFRPDVTETFNDENFGSSVVLNTDVTLGGIRWQAPGEDILKFDFNNPSGGPIRSISTPAGGVLALEAQGYSFEAPGGQNVLASTFLIQTVQNPIIGTGSVTVAGPSTIGLSPGNTFNGLHVVNGRLALWGVASSLGNLAGQGTIDDSSFGSGTVVLQNGEIGIVDIRAAPISPNISKNILINGGDNAIRSNIETIYSGNISGFGTLELGKSLFAHSFRFTTESTFGAGAPDGHIRTIAGTTTLAGPNGRLSGVDSMTIAGGGAANTSLVVGDSAQAPVDRINNAADLQIAGARVQFINGNAPTTEVVGKITLTSGMSQLSMTSGSSGSMTLDGGTLDRQNRAGLYVHGRQLGSGAATASTKIMFSNGAALAVGGGGADGTTNRSIIPFVFGNNTGTAPEANNGAGVASFVAYSAANGMDPLDLTTEYAQGLAGAGATDNVRLTSATTNSASSGQTINSLLLGSSTNNATTGFAATVTGGPLNITSGAVLATSMPLAAASAGPDIQAQLNFGAQEAVIMAVGTSAGAGPALTSGNGLKISGNITGTGGLTKHGPATLYLTGAKSFSGPVNIHQGRFVIGENVTPNVAGPLGNSNDAIILHSPSSNLSAGGSNQTRFLNENAPTSPVTIGRPLITQGRGSAGVMVGGFGSAAQGGVPRTIFTGSVTLNTPTYATVFATGDVEFTGTVSGPGVISDNVQAIGGSLRFTQNNSGWTGGLQVGGLNINQAGLLTGEADNAFGVGPIATSGQQVIRAVGPGQRTFSNSLDLDPAGSGAIGFDGNMKFTGDFTFATIEYATDVNSTFTVNGGFAINGNTNLELAGVLRDGAFQTVNQSVFGGTGTGSQLLLDGNILGGTVTLSNNGNLLDQRVHIGAAGHGTINNGTQTANAIVGKPGGTIRLTANGALGNAGVQVQFDESMLSLVGVTTGDNNILMRPGTGVGGKGSLHGESGNSVWGGNVVLLPTNGPGTTGTFTTVATVNSVGVAAGASLRVAGEFDDYTGTGAGVNQGTFVVDDANTQVLTKLGAGNLIVNRAADVNTFADLVGSDGTTVVVARGTASSLAGLDIRGGAVTVQQQGTPTSGSNVASGLSAVRDLDIATGAKLDLSNQGIVVDYTGGSPKAALEALVKQGRATGNWSGNGITSGTAAAGPSNQYAVGIAEITETTFSGSYLGLAVDTDAVLIKFTVAGDADLDNDADIDDFGRLAANFNEPGSWAEGDFDYSGTIDIDDFGMIAANFNEFVAGGLAGRPTAVPEPASMGLVGLAAVLAGRRRRSK